MKVEVSLNVAEEEATITHDGKKYHLSWGTGHDAGWHLHQRDDTTPGGVWIEPNNLCALTNDLYSAVGHAIRQLTKEPT